MRFAPLLLAASVLIATAVQAADPQPYTVRIDGSGNGRLDAALNASSQLVSLRKTAPAGPFALVGRAQQDIERLQTVLESFGYYQHHVSVSIDGAALADPALPDALSALPADKSAQVQVKIETGPLFHLRSVTLNGDVSDKARAAFALKSGAPAIASEVIAARQRLLDALGEEGHAFAKVDDPIAYQDAHDPVLDVSFKVDAGPQYEFGSVRFEGLRRVNESFLRQRLELRAGEPYSPSKLERARADLLALGTFSGVTVRLPKQEEVTDARLTITFAVEERLRHAVTLNAAYSTDLGGSGGATWSDRDVFGNAEQLNLGASIIDWGGSDTKSLGYDLTAELDKPDFLRTGQVLQFRLGALQQLLDAYDQTAASAGATLSRKLSPQWSVSVGLNMEEEKILQEGVRRYYTLVAIPLGAKYDSTGLLNPLEDAQHGLRASFSIAPTEALGGGHAASTVPIAPPTSPPPCSAEASASAGSLGPSATGDATFLVTQANMATYFDLSRLGWTQPGRSVIALRALAAVAYGAGQFSLPPDQRFYGGGSATVRGYRYESVGPKFPDCNPVGGVSIDAASAEFRQRLGGNLGAAVFVDAGEVSKTTRLFQSTPAVGYGAGLRYYTPIGAIRLDVSLPTRRPPGGAAAGDAFEVYAGLGQAF